MRRYAISEGKLEPVLVRDDDVENIELRADGEPVRRLSSTEVLTDSDQQQQPQPTS